MAVWQDSPELKSQANIVALDHPLGQRINVRGGGGKTTLSRLLAEQRSLAFIELDAIQWLPGWRERDGDDFRARTRNAIAAAPQGWVVDGNYTVALDDIVLREAYTVIWLDLAWRVMFWRIVRRSITRAADKKVICGSNTESWRHLFSRRSLWWYYVANRRQLIRRGERFLPLVPQGLPIVRIATARQLDRFYEIHGLVRD